MQLAAGYACASLQLRCVVTQEFNSVEAIKSAVQHGLGVAFVSVMAIEKELQLGLLGCVPIAGVRLARPLLLVTSPARTLSSAAQKFMQVRG
jgi:DNA-binding transcriptional LysR family regulator